MPFSLCVIEFEKGVELMKPYKIALIAHDHRKDDLLAWVLKHKEQLSKFELCGTGTTSSLIRKESGLTIESYLSGPLGGDQQIGAAIAQNEIQALIFFWDPLTSQPHDPDVKALLRIAVLQDIFIAMNVKTADALFEILEEENG